MSMQLLECKHFFLWERGGGVEYDNFCDYQWWGLKNFTLVYEGYELFVDNFALTLRPGIVDTF